MSTSRSSRKYKYELERNVFYSKLVIDGIREKINEGIKEIEDNSRKAREA